MIVAGFGFRASATEQSFSDAFLSAAAELPVDRLATAADKAHAMAFRSFAESAALPILAVNDVSLKAQQTATQSPMSHAARGTGSVAEASALAAAGRDAKLITSRVISADGLATCALAEGNGK